MKTEDKNLDKLQKKMFFLLVILLLWLSTPTAGVMFGYQTDYTYIDTATYMQVLHSKTWITFEVMWNTEKMSDF